MRSATASGPRILPSLLAASRRVAAALAAGALAGFTIGGIGGRVAMLMLRLTSSPALHGAETDDGFTIGIVSGATTFLLGFTMILGALGGVAYLLARPWLPEPLRPWAWGALGAAALWSGLREGIVRPWRSTPVVWLGRAGLLALGVSAGTQLVRDVAAIL